MFAIRSLLEIPMRGFLFKWNPLKKDVGVVFRCSALFRAPNRTEPLNFGTGRNRTRNRTEPNRKAQAEPRRTGKNMFTNRTEPMIFRRKVPNRTEPNRFLPAAGSQTKNLKLRGFDSSRCSTFKGGIPRPVGKFPGT